MKAAWLETCIPKVRFGVRIAVCLSAKLFPVYTNQPTLG